ncbi:MAG: nucleotide exchange factor GrpE [Clostridia bacterium]|nr:nucleotide exchange factor GrpE [Clostridia bacterium]
MEENKKINEEATEEVTEETSEKACDCKSEDGKKKCCKGSGREAKKEKKALDEKDAKIAELEAKLAEENDKYMRMMAEYDNFRKRVTKEKESIYGDSLCDTAAQLLPVLDNLERALEAESDKESGMYKGVEMVMKQCAEIFKKLGIEEIEALGKEFDANVHNAVMQDSDPDKGENEITAVFQKGYKRGEKVLRYAAVKVNS